MTAVDPDILATGIHHPPGRGAATMGMIVRRLAATDRRAYLAPLAVSTAGIVAGLVALFVNGWWATGLPIAVSLALLTTLAVVPARRRTGRLDRAGTVLAAAWTVLAIAHLVLPPYLWGWNINGVIHASAITAPALLAGSALTLSWATRRVAGDTPTATDLAVYPLLALPVVIALLAYGLLLGRVIVAGTAGLSLDVVVNSWGQQQVGSEFVYQVGLRNHILGTLFLMLLTCAISIVPGVGAAVFMTEHPGAVARVIGFCTTMLRAISVFIIGVALLGVSGLAGGLAPDSPLSLLVRGGFTVDESGTVQAARGSYLAAAMFLSLLVIPIITRFAEEGLRSVPRDLREGTAAMGATTAYGLRRVQLPWAAPNIVTGLLLGAAEAAGSLAIIMFVAGNGEHGVGLTTPVTGLDYALFATRYGSQPFISSMGYRAQTDQAYTAALLLLLITFGLTAGALLIRRRFAQRYRGSLTLG